MLETEEQSFDLYNETFPDSIFKICNFLLCIFIIGGLEKRFKKYRGEISDCCEVWINCKKGNENN